MFFVCISASATLLGVTGAISTPSSPMIPNSSGWLTSTQLLSGGSWETILFGGAGVGVIATIVGLITKQYVFAFILLVLWVMSLLIAPLQWFITGVPLLVNGLLAYVFFDTMLTVIQGVFTMFWAFIVFFAVIEMAAQRRVTGGA